MKLVIYPKSPKTNGNGRLPVKIFTNHEEAHDYSIDPRKVKSIVQVFYERIYYVVDYETNATDFELYRKSEKFAEFLLRNGKVDYVGKAYYTFSQSIYVAGYGKMVRKIRYLLTIDKDGLKFRRIEEKKYDEEELYE